MIPAIPKELDFRFHLIQEVQLETFDADAKVS